MVVYNRLNGVYEIFLYNLYSGLSVKKGVYGVFLNIGEMEGWVAVYVLIVRIVILYDNVIIIMYEGVSGGGKSEMC